MFLFLSLLEFHPHYLILLFLVVISHIISTIRALSVSGPGSASEPVKPSQHTWPKAAHTWPKAVQTWPKAVHTWPKAVHI